MHGKRRRRRKMAPAEGSVIAGTTSTRHCYAESRCQRSWKSEGFAIYRTDYMFRRKHGDGWSGIAWVFRHSSS